MHTPFITDEIGACTKHYRYVIEERNTGAEFTCQLSSNSTENTATIRLLSDVALISPKWDFYGHWTEIRQHDEAVLQENKFDEPLLKTHEASIVH